jgi:hypothetical protein
VLTRGGEVRIWQGGHKRETKVGYGFVAKHADEEGGRDAGREGRRFCGDGREGGEGLSVGMFGDVGIAGDLGGCETDGGCHRGEGGF